MQRRIQADTLKAFKAALLDVMIEIDEEFERDVKSVMEDILAIAATQSVRLDESVLEFVTYCTLVTYIKGSKFKTEILVGE